MCWCLCVVVVCVRVVCNVCMLFVIYCVMMDGLLLCVFVCLCVFEACLRVVCDVL